jgi:lipopolysaccharide export system ATP-binding protein
VKPLLEAKGIGCSLGGRVILSGLDLRLEAGTCLALLGPNGAGKSTAFSILAGSRRPSKGAVYLEGKDLAGIPLWRRVRMGLGYVPQRSVGFPSLTLRENLNPALESAGGNSAELDALLERLGLLGSAGVRMNKLSGGERRKMEIARCLISHPRCILLDEPFAGLDPLSLKELCSVISELAGEGIGVLLTDHRAASAMSISDRVVILDQGSVMLSGTVDEIERDEWARNRYLGI